VDEDDVIRVFAACELREHRIGEELGSRGGVAIATRLAAVATRALSGSGSGFPGPVRGLVASTRRVAGLTNSLAATFARAPAIGIAVVFVLAGLAVILAVSSSAGAWLSPALVALALLAAWTGYGWLSSPPTVARWLLLLVLLVVLGVVDARRFMPDDAGAEPWTWFAAHSAWDVLWWFVAFATLAGLCLVGAYLVGALQASKQPAIRVRGWLGFALLFLLAAPLTRYAWDRVVQPVTGTDSPAWKAWFASHDLVQIGLVVFVIGSLLIPLAELLSRED